MSNLGPNTGMGDKTDRGRNSDIYGIQFALVYLEIHIIKVMNVKCFEAYRIPDPL